MLIESSPFDYTDSDYLYVVWMEVFKFMFPRKKV